MSSRENPRGAIRDFIMAHFPAAKDRAIGDDDSLLASGIIDSLGVLEVVQFLEAEFDIVLSDEVLVSDHFETIASISRLVTEHCSIACGVE